MPVIICSQASFSRKELKNFEQAKEELRTGSIDRAISLLKALQGKYPENSEVLFSLAAAYVEKGEDDSALSALLNLVEANNGENPSVYNAISQIYERKKEFKSALNYLYSCAELIEPDSPLLKRVEQRIKQLQFKVDVLANPVDITIEPLDSKINSSYSEYLPQFSADGQNIVFTRRIGFHEDLLLAERRDSTWIVSSIEEINTLMNEGAHTLSADGQLLIFTRCDEKFGFGGCDLYQSQKSSRGWSPPRNLGSAVNSLSWESQPSLSSDGRFLFFSSSREGGHGGRDLYVTRKKQDGSWRKPVNLGEAVNGRGNEESPFFHPDNKTLYFRSDGRPGLGGYDIYMTRRDSSKWISPVHLGSPINTPENDGAMVVSLDGQYGYYATNYYRGERLDNLDIFKFNLPNQYRPRPMTFVKGHITDASTGMPLAALVTYQGRDSSALRVRAKANYNGDFIIPVPLGESVSLQASLDDFVFFSDYVQYDSVRHGSNPFFYEIALTPVEDLFVDSSQTAEIVLENIFFQSGSAILLSSSETELTMLHGLLIKNETLGIEIIGHTDNVGSTEDNLQLSLNRAESVKTALVAKGIMSERILTEGRGEEDPIASNETEEGRAENRRTTLRLISL